MQLRYRLHHQEQGGGNMGILWGSLREDLMVCGCMTMEQRGICIHVWVIINFSLGAKTPWFLRSQVGVGRWQGNPDAVVLSTRYLCTEFGLKRYIVVKKCGGCGL